MTRYGAKMELTPFGETIQMTPSRVETTQLKAIKGKTAFMAAQATIRSQVETHPQISFMAAMEMI